MWLAGFRTALDKFCRRHLTLGLVMPRRPKRRPIILSREEVVRLLQAAPSLRDKLLLGLLYASGVRVGEVVRLQCSDVDFDRRTMRVRQGKGRQDRYVMLPECFDVVLRRVVAARGADEYLFPGQRPGRHLSPRTAQRAMKRATGMAGIRKRCSPHTLRHSFATHLSPYRQSTTT